MELGADTTFCWWCGFAFDVLRKDPPVVTQVGLKRKMFLLPLPDCLSYRVYNLPHLTHDVVFFK